jgi:uncharacterized protein YecE (DUF72 family)
VLRDLSYSLANIRWRKFQPSTATIASDSTKARTKIRIGTAGWAIPAPIASEFPGEGSTLARYASVLDAAEINSTFRKSHRATTYERWSSAVTGSFEFSVKVPKAVTHEARLANCDVAIDAFLKEVLQLGPKLRVLLLQLPPSFVFAPDLVDNVCRTLGNEGRFTIACEPRHASWFVPAVDDWLAERGVARVASDPARHAGAGEPGGWRGLSYYRWHGSPRMYYSSYDDEALARLRDQIEHDTADEKWCIFDNTASGAAASNALTLARMLGSGDTRVIPAQ